MTFEDRELNEHKLGTLLMEVLDICDYPWRVYWDKDSYRECRREGFLTK